MSALFRQIFTKVNTLTRTGTLVKNVCTPRILARHTSFLSNLPTPHEVVDPDKDKLISDEIIKKVNEDIQRRTRLFAIVHVTGKQFKITEGDVLIIEGYWPPECGDKISLDKILMIGSENFTLIGKPVIQSGIAEVHATVIEKGLSHTKTHFRKKRRKQYMRINFYRIPHTVLRINKIEIKGEVNNPPDVTGLENVIF